MSEMICPLCNTPSPENALYCQQCGQPLKCQACGAYLLPTAHACIQCGKLIPERSNNDQLQAGTSMIPPGYNRLKFHEVYAADVRDLDLTVTDHAITQIGAYLGDLIPSLMGSRLKGYSNSSPNHQQQRQSDVVEIALDTLSPKPQLTAASSPQSLPKNSPEELIWEIFRKEDGGTLKLDITNLKASGKWDHILRLVYLYIYAKMQSNGEKTLRTEVYTFLDNLGLLDTHNISRFINKAEGISSDEDGTLRLAFEGRKLAEKYIGEVFNDEFKGTWLTSSESRTIINRTKKPSKKSGEQHSSVDTNVAVWVTHKETKNLAGLIPPDIIVGLSLVDKSLLALYGIYRTGNAQEVPFTSVIKYLYDAFHVQVKPNTLSNALYRTREEKTVKASYLNFREGHGYRITPLGRQYIEGLLKLPKFETADVKLGTNGAG